MATFRGGLVSAQSTPSPYTQANQLINYLFIIFGPAWGLSFLSFLRPVPRRANLNLFALSGEGVPSLRSVLATGLVSRDAQEFGISQACRL